LILPTITAPLTSAFVDALLRRPEASARIRRGRLAPERIQLSYTDRVPEEIYTFTERTYQYLAKAGVNPLAVTDVLYGGGVVRRHIGAALQVAGQDREGTWLAVALVEDDDDQYTVTSARYLDADEIAGIGRMRREQR
jgi:hypothetical protein